MTKTDLIAVEVSENHLEKEPLHSKKSRDVAKTMTNNDKSCNSALKQFHYKAEAKASSKMVELSR